LQCARFQILVSCFEPYAALQTRLLSASNSLVVTLCDSFYCPTLFFLFVPSFLLVGSFFFFFFQAEDGIRDWSVTGVQTCALPISGRPDRDGRRLPGRAPAPDVDVDGRQDDGALHDRLEIGRASCRERV